MRKNAIVAGIIFLVGVLLMFFSGANVWFGMLLLIIAAVVFWEKKPKKTIDDIKLLWHYAKSTPAGTWDLPEWGELNVEGRGWQRIKNFFFGIYTYNKRRYVVILDTIIGLGHSPIHYKHPVSNKLTVSQVRDIAIKDAFGMREKITPLWLDKKVKEFGGRVIWGGNVLPSTQQIGGYVDENDIDDSA